MSALYLDARLSEENSGWTITKRDAAGVGTAFITNYGQGILSYNPVLDMYLGMYTNPPAKMEYINTQKLTCRAIVHEASNRIFWLIPQNATGTLLASLKYFAYAEKPNTQHLWDTQTITLDDYKEHKDEYKDMKHVVVLQAPENRFSRRINRLICKNELKDYLKDTLPSSMQENLENIQMFTWQMLAIAELNAASGTAACDEYLLPQYRYMELLPKPDVVVPMELLDFYLQDELNITPVHENCINDIQYWLGKVQHDGVYGKLQTIYGKDHKLSAKYSSILYR